MKKIKLILALFIFSLVLLLPAWCRAMPPGTLLYRTSGGGKMSGYSGDPLIYAEKGILKDIYAGHVGIYIGQENGEDYIVEAMAGGIVKTPAKYFVNSANGEILLGAKIPSAANSLQVAKVVALAKSLAAKNLAYDLDFKYQKGPGDGAWTCVGLAEKLYESADISNPNNLAALEYDPDYYAVDITPDGFDNYSTVNPNGDCFAKEREFSKIARRTDLLIPAPELIGYDVGLEYQGERYIFLPYTQFLQKSLRTVTPDILLTSAFNDTAVRGPLDTKALVLRWSLINNPISSLKNLAQAAGSFISQAASKTAALAKSLGAKIFGENSLAEIDFTAPAALGSTTTKKTVKTTATSAGKNSSAAKNSNGVGVTAASASPAGPLVKVNKSKGVANLKNSGTNQAPVSSLTLANSSAIKTSATKSSANDKTNAAKTSTSSKTLTATKNAETNTSSATKTATNYYAPSLTSLAAASGGGASSNAAPLVDNWPKLARINKIYATGNNDWVELINTTDHDFDLAAANYRLERTKTAEDPSLIMRLGDPDDGLYPGGTIIKAHGTYLIVRADASVYYKDRADAIATREEFSWTANGYTIYLGVGAITSSADSDIIDAVGFGPDATYFQGAAAASEIKDNYVLERIGAIGDNQADFKLIAATDPESLAALAVAQAALTETATSSESNATTSSEVATTTAEIATSTDNVATTSDNIATSTDNVATSTDQSPPAPLALINRIYATGDNDFIELLNTTNNDFDLAAANYRLEKTKTAEAPSLLMRIGNTNDGLYPGGTIIKAQGKYLIVRDDASAFFKNQADAIATRDEFTWTDTGYTFYLGAGAISSSTDVNIKDLVGIGSEAVYWQGSGPAPAINDNYILNRIGQSRNNHADFNLILSDDPAIILTPPTDPNLDLFVAPTPLVSPGLVQLWHFDACAGPGHWAVGRWDCARELSYNYEKFNAALDPPLDLNNFTASFYYRASSQFPRLDLRLTNAAGDHILLILDPGMLTVEGLPNSDWRYFDPGMVFDDKWHQATLVINQASDYWAVYIDGQKIIQETSYADLPLFSQVEMSDDNGLAIFDELALWQRALNPAEILADYLAAAPYSPPAFRAPQSAAQLLQAWDFTEDYGSTATDRLGQLVLNVDPTLWVGRSHENYALRLSDGTKYILNFPNPLISQDLSLAFWWRNAAYPNGGRTNINLKGGADGATDIMSLVADDYRPNFLFNGISGIISDSLDKTIPYDDKWHHLALIYDSYRYKLNFYVDGEIKYSSALVRLEEGTSIKQMQISTDNFYTELDDLNIYSGALSAAQVKQLFTESQ